MGGRGGSSGLTSGNLSNGFNGKWFGVSVTNSGGKKTEYFFKQNGKGTLMRIGLQATPKQSTITPQKFVENAKRNSRNVNIISPTETSKRIEKRKKKGLTNLIMKWVSERLTETKKIGKQQEEAV